MRVNFLSEGEIIFSVGHGIQSAYHNQLSALKKRISVVKNRMILDDSDLVHLHTYGPIALIKAVMSKKPVIISSHTLPEEAKGSVSVGWLLSRLFLRYLPIVYNSCDLVIAPSVFNKMRLQKIGVKKEIAIVSNGVNTKKFRFSEKKGQAFRREHGIGDEDVVVYTVGAIIPRKGVYTFLELAKRFPDVRFIWVGLPLFKFLGADFFKIRKLMESKPKNVIFTGYVFDIIAAYSAGDIFLFPTHHETQGVALLEAAACSRPLLVRDIEAFNGWLINGENCLKGRSVLEFSSKLKRLIENEELRAKLSKNARKLAEKNDINLTSDELFNIYKKVVQRGRTEWERPSLINIAYVFTVSILLILGVLLSIL